MTAPPPIAWGGTAPRGGAHSAALWAPLRAYEGLDFDFPALGERSHLGRLEWRRENLRRGLNYQSARLALWWADTEADPDAPAAAT